MKKIAKIIGVVILILALFLTWKFYLRFLPFVPHERITISLPFEEKDDDLIFINPMGETDHHDPPRGHPGLDFGWDYPAPLIAAADGKVTKIEEHPPTNEGETEKIYDMELVSGIYAIRYDEMKPREDLKVGMEIKKGEVVGRGGKYKGGELGIYYFTHWEFDYDTMIIDRLCPLTYFDKDSLDRINSIWAKVGETFNGQFPEVCSGFYKGRDK